MIYKKNIYSFLFIILFVTFSKIINCSDVTVKSSKSSVDLQQNQEYSLLKEVLRLGLYFYLKNSFSKSKHQKAAEDSLLYDIPYTKWTSFFNEKDSKKEAIFFTKLI